MSFVEIGDIYFFYRNKVDIEKASSRGDVQRFYIVLVPDEASKGRIFVVGRKRMPEIIEGESKATEREWLLCYKAEKPEKLREYLAPVSYETETKGERTVGEAIPVGQGRYLITEGDSGESRLIYRLEQPEKPGKAQKELGIFANANYVIAVRNPRVKVSGFPNETPDYPKSLAEKFADERWIGIDDSRLIDYENTQLVLIGARKNSEEMLDGLTGRADLFRKLGLNKTEWPTESLEKGEFAAPQYLVEAEEPEGDRSKGGKRGGRVAVQTASAAGIARALKGIDFPKAKSGLIRYAEKSDADEEIIKALKDLPQREFETMADVQKGLGEVR